MKINQILKVLSLTLALSSVGCGNIADLAEGYLYPVTSANKTKVPDQPPEGYEQAFLKVPHPKGELRTHLWSYKNPRNPNAPVLIHFHGNGENIGALSGGFMETMELLDAHFVIMDYPGYGKSTGKPEQSTLMAGAQATLDWTRAKFPNSRVVVWGWSLGAAVAIQTVGLNPGRVDALIADSGWTSVRELAKEKFGSMAEQIPEELLKRNEWNSKAMASKIKVLTLMRHGTKDTLIPYKFGQNLSGVFDRNLISFITMSGKTHTDIFQEKSYWNEIGELLHGQ